MGLRVAADRSSWRRIRPALALALLVLGSLALRAQDDSTFYSRHSSFRIPFTIDKKDEARVQQVILSVSEDLGKTYRQGGTARPAASGFTFTARHDGWYYFTVQTQDLERRLNPPTAVGAEPGLKVYVDTVPPEVRIHPGKARPGLISVEWDIRDEMLDLSTLKLDYRTQGALWQERQVQRNAVGQASWEFAGKGAVDVRVSVKDKAGNLGEATTTVDAEGGTPPDRGNIGDRTPRGGDGDRTPGGNADPESLTKKVNSRKIRLNFKLDDVGPSDVSTIEVWKTRDTLRWEKLAQPAQKTPPIEIEVEEEGRYGFTLIAKSGVGLGEATPRPRDQPQVWIEVDLKKPVVEMTIPVVGRGIDKGKLTINWTAKDKNLGRQPIALSYSKTLQGTWIPIPGAATLENSGRHIWEMPTDLPFEFFVRVEATDEAGNIGQATTTTTVKVDLSVPKAIVIGVEPIK